VNGVNLEIDAIQRMFFYQEGIMFKNAQRGVPADDDVRYAIMNNHTDWTLLNKWNEERDFVPRGKHNGGSDYGVDPIAANAVELLSLSFAGLFRSVMKHTAMLEEEIGKKALEQFHLGRIRDSCVHGVNLVYRLMVLYGKIPMKIRQFDLNDIVRSIDPFISRIMRDDITIEIDMAEDDLPMTGDIRFIKQAIAELILNANEALPSGGTFTLATRKVKLRLNSPDLAYGEPTGCALLSVIDTGKGIDEEIRPRIFRPFFTTKSKGTFVGLGLPLVDHVVRAHNGSYKLMSKKGEGTSVRIYLPLGRSHSTDDEKGQPNDL
jgi:two-component system, cell cycle sensor histidine kinase and response regulator CckA